MEGDVIHEDENFILRRIRILKANERLWILFREYFSNLEGTFAHFRVFEREQSVRFERKFRKFRKLLEVIFFR